MSTWWRPRRSGEAVASRGRSPSARRRCPHRGITSRRARGGIGGDGSRQSPIHAILTLEARVPEVGMRFPVTLARNLSLTFNNLRERSARLWNSDRPRHARDWLSTHLKEAYSRVRAARLARPGVFWAVLLGSLTLVIVF